MVTDRLIDDSLGLPDNRSRVDAVPSAFFSGAFRAFAEEDVPAFVRDLDTVFALFREIGGIHLVTEITEYEPEDEEGADEPDDRFQESEHREKSFRIGCIHDSISSRH